MSERKTITVRGQTVVVYDVELMLMLIKDWSAKGMLRADIEDLLLAA